MNTEIKQFKVFAPTSTKQTTLNDDGTLTITGIASTTNRDLDGDVVTSEAIKSLAEQVVGLNLHLDHNHRYDGVIGTIQEATIQDDSLLITAIILDEYAESILNRLNLGINFGFSIGGIPTIGERDYSLITDFKLLEVSLTPLPANWDTFGTVESKGIVKSNCLTGACHYILKNRDGDNMEIKNEGSNNGLTEEQVIALINEAFSENTQTFIDEIRNELTNIVNEIVDSKIEELKPAKEDKSEENDPQEDKNEETTSEEEKPVTDEEEVTDETKSDDDTGEETKPEDVSKMVEEIVANVFKKLDHNRNYAKSKFTKFTKPNTSKSFLNSETRDQFGRNRKYL